VYGELLSLSMQIFVRHADVLLTLAILVVTPVTLVVDGAWGGALANGVEAKPSPASFGVSGALSIVVVFPLVTAVGARIVDGLARGEPPPGVGALLREAIGAFPQVAVTVAVYAVATAAGFLLFVVPGVWLAIRWCVAPQAAALGRRPADAIRQSHALVGGVWWRTCGCVLMTSLLLIATGTIASNILGSTGSGALYVAGLIVSQSVALAITSVFGTLLLFDLRARQGRRAAVGAGADKMTP
jgi:hypothetical protein